MSLLVVIDIDGTISDATDRFRLAGPAPELNNLSAYLSWVDAVNENMQYDSKVPGMRDLLRSLKYGGAHCVYITNREEKHRQATEDWLSENGFPSFEVMMREDGSYSEAADYKGTIIHNLRQVFGFKEVVVIDDDGDGNLEKLCLSKGYTFLKARSGGGM